MKTKDKKEPVQTNPALETQMQALAENPTQATVPMEHSTALLPKEDFRVEQIKKSNGSGDRIAVRAASGKFTKLTTAVAAKDAREAQQFLAEKVKNEVGVELSRKAQLREALFSGAISAAKSDKGIGGAVKAFEALNVDAALTGAKETMLQPTDHIQNPIRVVMVGIPENMLHPEIVDFDKKSVEKKQPSFAEGVVIQQDGPSGMLR